MLLVDNYVNVDIEDMKRAAIKSLKNNEAVWFGCDVGKMFHRDLGIMMLIYMMIMSYYLILNS